MPKTCSVGIESQIAPFLAYLLMKCVQKAEECGCGSQTWISMGINCEPP